MSPVRSDIRVLLGKELRQVRRSRGALASATLLPLLFMTVLPLVQLFSMRGASSRQIPGSQGFAPAGIEEMAQDPMRGFAHVILPLFIALGGLIVPSVSATYTVVAEREKRSLDLLMALPVRAQDILLAKLLSMLVLAAGVVLPLFAINMVVVLGLGLLSWLDAVLLLVLLLSAMACSVCMSLLLALLARDYRTANNLTGVFLGPVIVLSMAVLFLVPGQLRFVPLIGLLLAIGGVAVVIGLRWLTFERYLA